MSLSPQQFLRSGGGELTVKHFPSDEDPEEVLQGYIADAMPRVASVDEALQDGLAAKWVYYRAYQGAYSWMLTEPQQTSVGEAGSVNFLTPDGLLKLALDYKEAFELGLAAALSAPKPRPFGVVRNEYIF